MKQQRSKKGASWYYVSLTAESHEGKRSPVFGKVGFKSRFERRWEALIGEQFELGPFGSDHQSFHALVKIAAAQSQELQPLLDQLLEEMPSRSVPWKYVVKKLDDPHELESVEFLIAHLGNGRLKNAPLPPKDGGNGHPTGPETV
jgi:hypothetical protein